MSNTTIQISDSQIINALSQFPAESLKKLIDQLFRKKLYSPPPLSDIVSAGCAKTRRARLEPEVADEAVKWARSKK